MITAYLIHVDNAALLVLNKDKKLKKIISSVGEYDIRIISNPFEALVEAIITQQISDSCWKVNIFKI